MDKHVDTPPPVTTWDELIDVYKKEFYVPREQSHAKLWVYRANECTCLTSSLDQALSQCRRSPDAYYKVERYLIREFKRRYHHYESRVPDDDDYLQWLAIMQHYGAPTRLLDWTYSFYVAVYFALNRAHLEYHSSDCSVEKSKDAKSKETRTIRYLIAIDMFAARKRANEQLRKVTKGTWNSDIVGLLEKDGDVLKQFNSPNDREAFGNVVMENKVPFVYPVTPFHLNDRLSAQQGTFLCAGTVEKNFQENLDAGSPLTSAESRTVSIAFDVEETQRSIFELSRMNITQLTLFPGLQGFAESLANNWCILEPGYPIDGIPLYSGQVQTRTIIKPADPAVAATAPFAGRTPTPPPAPRLG